MPIPTQICPSPPRFPMEKGRGLDRARRAGRGPQGENTQRVALSRGRQRGHRTREWDPHRARPPTPGRGRGRSSSESSPLSFSSCLDPDPDPSPAPAHPAHIPWLLPRPRAPCPAAAPSQELFQGWALPEESSQLCPRAFQGWLSPRARRLLGHRAPFDSQQSHQELPCAPLPPSPSPAWHGCPSPAGQPLPGWQVWDQSGAPGEPTARSHTCAPARSPSRGAAGSPAAVPHLLPPFPGSAASLRPLPDVPAPPTRRRRETGPVWSRFGMGGVETAPYQLLLLGNALPCPLSAAASRHGGGFSLEQGAESGRCRRSVPVEPGRDT